MAHIRKMEHDLVEFKANKERIPDSIEELEAFIVDRDRDRMRKMNPEILSVAMAKAVILELGIKISPGEVAAVINKLQNEENEE